MTASGARDFDAIIIGSGPGGSTAADILTAAGMSVVIFEKGRNHLIDLDDPNRLAEEFSNDEIKFFRRYFLGPDPFLEPRTYRRDNDDGDHLFAGQTDEGVGAEDRRIIAIEVRGVGCLAHRSAIPPSTTSTCPVA